MKDHNKALKRIFLAQYMEVTDHRVTIKSMNKMKGVKKWYTGQAEIHNLQVIMIKHNQGNCLCTLKYRTSRKREAR